MKRKGKLVRIDQTEAVKRLRRFLLNMAQGRPVPGGCAEAVIRSEAHKCPPTGVADEARVSRKPRE
jgi:hypothetical protein